MPSALVTLTIEKAEGLIGLNPGNTSNPYIQATIGAQTVSTAVINKTVNPVFAATFTFHACALPAVMTLRAFNRIQYVDVEDPLGTATVTLFDLQPEATTKVVQLGHGGVAALAQRAPTGCGAVTISYSVTEEAAPAAPTERAATPKANNSSLPSTSSTPLHVPVPVPVLPPTPMAVPAANNIDGNSFAAMPVASIPRESRATTPKSIPALPGGFAHGSQLFASNPSTSNPAATTPMLRPLEDAGSAAAPAAATTTADGSSGSLLASMQQPSNILTPPSLSPARPPANVTYLVPQEAPAPPALAAVYMPVKTVPTNGYESYAVPGVKMPPPMPVAQPAAAVTLDASTESYYANNTSHNAAAGPGSMSMPTAAAAGAPLATLSGVYPPSASSLGMLPVAPAAARATRFASLQESTSAALSFDGQQQTLQPQASESSLYTSAAQAPPPSAPATLLVVPPNIHGAPTPTFFHASQAPSREVSRLNSAAQLSGSLTCAGGAAAGGFPVQALTPGAAAAALPISTGALPVATAPRTPPLSSSTTPSLRSTPAALSSSTHSRQNGAAAYASTTFTSESPIPSGAARSGGMRRGIAPAPATAGLQHGAAVGAAFPDPASRTGVASAGTTSPKRRSARSETTNAAAGTGITTAEQLYADAAYLFEMAASGADLEVFAKLREVDPSLTNGFLECLDYSGRSLLHIAAWNGQLRVLQLLLSPEPVAPMIDLRAIVAAKSGNTVLHAAACGGQAEVAQWLRYSHPFAGSLLLSVHNARGMTAAECAMEAGFPQVARLLLPS